MTGPTGEDWAKEHCPLERYHGTYSVGQRCLCGYRFAIEPKLLTAEELDDRLWRIREDAPSPESGTREWRREVAIDDVLAHIAALEHDRDALRLALAEAERWLDEVGTAGAYWHVQLQLLMRRLNIVEDEARVVLEEKS